MTCRIIDTSEISSYPRYTIKPIASIHVRHIKSNPLSDSTSFIQIDLSLNIQTMSVYTNGYSFCTIGAMPQEIIEIIFNQLPLRDQKSARLVCHRWYAILDQDRFFSGLKLAVRPSTLSSNYALQKMNRPFGTVLIASDDAEDRPEWRAFVRRASVLMRSAKIVENVELLSLMVSISTAEAIFGVRRDENTKATVTLIYSPVTKKSKLKLRKKYFGPMVHQLDGIIVKLPERMLPSWLGVLTEVDRFTDDAKSLARKLQKLLQVRSVCHSTSFDRTHRTHNVSTRYSVRDSQDSPNKLSSWTVYLF